MSDHNLLAPGTTLHLIPDTPLHRRLVFIWRTADGKLVEYAVIVIARRRWSAAEELRSSNLAKERGGLVIAASDPDF